MMAAKTLNFTASKNYKEFLSWYNSKDKIEKSVYKVDFRHKLDDHGLSLNFKKTQLDIIMSDAEQEI